MLYNKESFGYDKIQSQFDCICNIMHTKFMFEDIDTVLETKYDLLVDIAIKLLNDNLYQISIKNELDEIIKYDPDEDGCPLEFEYRKIIRIQKLEDWLNVEYNIFFEGSALIY